MERGKVRALRVAGILVGCWIPIVVLAFIEFIYFFEMTFYGPPPPKQTGEIFIEWLTAVLLCSYCVLGMLLSLLRPASVWAIGMTLGSVSLNGYLLLIGDMHQPTLALALLCSWMAVVIGRISRQGALTMPRTTDEGPDRQWNADDFGKTNDSD